MPTTTYTALATVTLGSTATSVTFGNIPNTYKDLVLVVSGSYVSSANDSTIRINGDSGSSYTTVSMCGAGVDNVGSIYTASATSLLTGYYGPSLGMDVVNFIDYSSTNKNKTILSRYGTANLSTVARVGRWISNSPISSITYFAGTAGNLTFNSGSTFDLYGILG